MLQSIDLVGGNSSFGELQLCSQATLPWLSAIGLLTTISELNRKSKRPNLGLLLEVQFAFYLSNEPFDSTHLMYRN
jgi:hypothetical protein